MKSYLALISLILVLNSCSDIEKQEVVYSNYNFELPIEVKKAEDLFNLSFGEYYGFFMEISGERLIKTQLENQPLFMGNDNVGKETYYGDRFIGITFFENIESQSLSEIKKSLEKQYKSEFQKRTEKQITHVEGLNVLMEFYQLKTETGLNIILKKVNRKLTNKVFVGVAFYPNLSDATLMEYVTWIN